MSVEKGKEITVLGERGSSNLNEEIWSWISTTKSDSEFVLDLSRYQELIEYADSISEWIDNETFDIDSYNEAIYDFFSEYSIIEVYNTFKKIRYWENIKNEVINDPLCSLEIELVPIKRLIKKYENEVVYDLKNQILSEIKLFVEKILKKYKFTLLLWWENQNLDFDMMYEVNSRSPISFKLWEISLNTFWVEEIAFFLQKIKLEEKFNNEVWKIDIEKLKQETLKYWAKWANLRLIREILDIISSFSFELNNKLYIPFFDTVDVIVYDKWKKWEEISNDLKPYYEQIKWKKIIIRSSAVYSEDREDSTWAWIYESIEFDFNKSFEDFLKIVEKVYESVDSKRAIKYRLEKWIENEKMWLIIQELVEEEGWTWDDFNCIREKWYVNTVVKWVPRLIDISLQKWLRPIVDKNMLLRRFVHEYSQDSIFYYQLDTYKLEDSYMLVWLAMFTYMLEKYYNKPLQIEFITSEFYSFNLSSSEKKHAILQVRYLPSNYSEIKKIVFPDKEVLFEWRALWIWDLELDVLPNWEDNSKKEWITIFESSKFTSTEGGMEVYNLPDSWVVIVLWESSEDHWHIETLCAEKWILLIFNKNHKPSYYIEPMRMFWDEESRCYTDELWWYKRLHVVMDGLIGKVYPA